MTDQILVPVNDAEHIADLLRTVDDDGEAEVYADLLDDHAANESFDDGWTEIGPLDEFIKQHADGDGESHDGDVSLTYAEGYGYSARHVPTDVASQGPTEEEALRNLAEALTLHRRDE